jgi:DNA ligase-1
MKYVAGFLLLVTHIVAASPPQLQLANVYHDDIKLDNYWVSEKYDGVRAFWNGHQLLSRQGNIIQAPAWFIQPLPDAQLDGELWIARGMFDQVSGIVRRHSPTENDWQRVRYMLFDLPASSLTFDGRLRQLKSIVMRVDRPHVQLVKQEKLKTQELLMQKLDAVVAAGGEGLMLHRGSSSYKASRSDDLLKLKKYADAEAIVMSHISGKGKYVGLMGSILVETEDGNRFKIGTGFSDEERKKPPPIGSVITYKFFGLTSKGTPRFASFLRVRNAH